MTENSSSTVGRAAIDSYLDSVELALIAADAPRIDRQQVLQDLEAQIADMLAQQPSPLTDEVVQSIIQSLEPPSHFAATYGSPQPVSPASEPQLPWRTQLRWPVVGAASCGLLLAGCLLALLAAATNNNGPLILLSVFMMLVGFAFTPFALWRARRELSTHPERAPDRDLILKSTVAYVVVSTTLPMAFLTAITEGYALMPLGVAAFIYLQYILVRRLWRRMSDPLPPQRTAPPVKQNGNGARSPLSPAAMPAT